LTFAPRGSINSETFGDLHSLPVHFLGRRLISAACALLPRAQDGHDSRTVWLLSHLNDLQQGCKHGPFSTSLWFAQSTNFRWQAVARIDSGSIARLSSSTVAASSRGRVPISCCDDAKCSDYRNPQPESEASTDHNCNRLRVQQRNGRRKSGKGRQVHARAKHNSDLNFSWTSRHAGDGHSAVCP